MELLVVIGIIAVLIAILLPVLSKSRAAANRAQCLSTIKQLYNGILMDCNDNHGCFPTCAFADDGSGTMQHPDDWIWWEANRPLDDSAIAKYVGRGEQLKSLLRCPAYTFDGRKTKGGISAGQGPYAYSYDMNTAMRTNFVPYNHSLFGMKINQWRAAEEDPSDRASGKSEPRACVGLWRAVGAATRHREIARQPDHVHRSEDGRERQRGFSRRPCRRR